jgi:hypothetical protein
VLNEEDRKGKEDMEAKAILKEITKRTQEKQ